jgi:competence protein ComGC
MRKFQNLKAVSLYLIELLVVISIIALLISILLSALQKAREQAKLVICTQQERQIMQIELHDILYIVELSNELYFRTLKSGVKNDLLQST